MPGDEDGGGSGVGGMEFGDGHLRWRFYIRMYIGGKKQA